MESYSTTEGTINYWTIELKASKYSNSDSFVFRFPVFVESGDRIVIQSKQRSVWDSNYYDMLTNMVHLNITYKDIYGRETLCNVDQPPMVSNSQNDMMPFSDGLYHFFEILIDKWDALNAIVQGSLQGQIKIDYQNQIKFSGGSFVFALPEQKRF